YFPQLGMIRRLPLARRRRENCFVAQIGLFSRAQITAMRDRTRSRNYSPERDAFRREHQRHRDWGLTQRYARKERHLRAAAANRPGAHSAPAMAARSAASTAADSPGVA